MKILTFTTNIEGKVQRITHDGSEFLIAPVVALVEGVVNGELAPADEIGQYVGAWDGRPFILDHPEDDEGLPISANDPDILAERRVGWLYGSEFTDARIKGNIWVEIERAERNEDGKELVRRLEAGERVEVSTAYFRDLEEKAGTFNGEDYTVVQHNIRPDHLAALLHATGACDWKDGCGTPRTNQGEGMHVNVLSTARRPEFFSTSTDVWIAPTLSDYLTWWAGDPPEMQQVADIPKDLKEWIAGHTLLGDPEADNFIDLAFFPVVNPRTGDLNKNALMAVIGGQAAQADIPAPALTSAQSVARSLLEKEFDMPKPEKQTTNSKAKNALVALARTFGIPISFKEDRNMDREKVIAKLVKDGRIGLTAEHLTALDDDALGALEKHVDSLIAADAEKVAADEKAAAEKEAAEKAAGEGNGGDGQEEAPPADNADKSPCMEKVMAFMDAVEKRGGLNALMAQADALKATQDADKSRLVEILAANEACRLSKEQLTTLALDTLQGIEASFRPVDYTGRGAIVTQGGNDGENSVPLERPTLLVKKDEKEEK